MSTKRWSAVRINSGVKTDVSFPYNALKLTVLVVVSEDRQNVLEEEHA